MYMLCRIILIAFVVACGCALCFLVPVLGGGLSCLLLFCGLAWRASPEKEDCGLLRSARHDGAERTICGAPK